ncbi:MAG: glycerophosphodiester phosphodiesterase [Oligoflexales bacterium]
MLIIAHRGVTENAPENSWSAFEQAVKIGCDRIELDIRLTKDDIPIVMHDHTLNRTCSKNGIVSNLNYNEIKSIYLKNGENIPLFSEVLEHFAPKIELNVELKGNNGKLASIVGTIIRNSPHKDRIILSTFSEKPLLYLQQNFPTLRRAVLWGYDTLRSHPLYFFNPLWFLKNCKTNIFHPEAQLLSKKLMYRLSGNDLMIYPWVPMKGEEIRPHKLWAQMIQLKVNGLCTNKPQELRKFIVNKD